MTRKRFEVRDQNLWDEITRSIRPFRKSQLKSTTAAAAPALVHKPQANAQLIPRPVYGGSERLVPPPIAAFDRRTGQKLMRGKADIEARLDLHGLSLEDARYRLLRFLKDVSAQGLSLVLVITGKGASPFAGHTLHGRDHFYVPEREGKLRRQFPEWLHEAEFRALVTGFQPAHPKHGGGGAFYVKLRSNRSVHS